MSPAWARLRRAQAAGPEQPATAPVRSTRGHRPGACPRVRGGSVHADRAGSPRYPPRPAASRRSGAIEAHIEEGDDMSKTIRLAAAAAALFAALPAVGRRPCRSRPRLPADAGLTLVSGGCGPGFHRGPFLGCRPNGAGRSSGRWSAARRSAARCCCPCRTASAADPTSPGGTSRRGTSSPLTMPSGDPLSIHSTLIRNKTRTRWPRRSRQEGSPMSHAAAPGRRRGRIWPCSPPSCAASRCWRAGRRRDGQGGACAARWRWRGSVNTSGPRTGGADSTPPSRGVRTSSTRLRTHPP